MEAIHLLTITGPTACGKTRLAVEVACKLDGEIVSADSRQVFRGMDIGSGKDLGDYEAHGKHIDYHLIDIAEAGEEYNLYRFMNDFSRALSIIIGRHKQPILCGGTGLYIDSIVSNYQLSNAPINPQLRASLADIDNNTLTERLSELINLHNNTDTETRERLIRALEIAEYRTLHPEDCVILPPMQHTICAINMPRPTVIERIETRLRNRLEGGMIEEVQALLSNGVPKEQLIRYGLEYKHLTLYLTKQCSFHDMEVNLFTDIRRFAKRQMTWLRHMERKGVKIQWIDGTQPLDSQVENVLYLFRNRA